MSASDKKKLRKEQNAATMTEKQQKEAKETKKLKAYTISFVVVMVLVVAIILGATLRAPVAGIIDRNTDAISVGEHKISTAEFGFFYAEAINNFVSQFEQYGDYATLYMQMMGLDPSKALGDQVYDQTTGKTWADYFIESAKNSAKWTYGMYDAAMKAGFTLSAEDTKAMDSIESTLSLYAQYAGYSSTTAYLRSVYGNGATVKNYTEYYKLTTIASKFATQYRDGLTYTDAQYREFEKDKMHEYNSYSYALHRINSSDYLKFLGLGTVTKGEDGKETTTYTEADKQKALEAALADAQALTAAGINNMDKLNEAINKLAINVPKEEDKTEDKTEGKAGETEDDKTEEKPEDKPEEKDYAIKATEGKDVLYSSIASNSNEGVQKWLTSSIRKVGDVAYVEIASGEGDERVVTGYYVVMYLGVNDNNYKSADVQHILVKFEGGKKDANGNTIYSQVEKDKAQAEAQAILDGFLKETKQDTDVFGLLAKEKSDDTGSKANGGLISNITLDAGYVEPFTTWALAEHKVGDTGLVETEYGWHVMFYKASSELTYRDQMIKSGLVTRDYVAWEEEILKNVTVTDINLNGVDRDFTISG